MRNPSGKGLHDAHPFEERKYDRRGQDRTDLASSICAHRVHEKVIPFISLLSFHLDYPGRHGERRDPGGAD